MHALALDGMELARRGARFLYENGAKRVVVFGSVAKGRRLDMRSDLDLAVEGLPSNDFLRIGAQLEELLDFSVDLVELERASPELHGEIERHAIFIPRED